MEIEWAEGTTFFGGGETAPNITLRAAVPCDRDQLVILCNFNHANYLAT